MAVVNREDIVAEIEKLRKEMNCLYRRNIELVFEVIECIRNQDSERYNKISEEQQDSLKRMEEITAEMRGMMCFLRLPHEEGIQ